MSDTNAAAAPLRVAVSDGDSGFVQVLTKRLDRLGWEHVVMTGAVPVERLVSMRLGAFVSISRCSARTRGRTSSVSRSSYRHFR